MEAFLSDKVFTTNPQTADSLILLVYCIDDAHGRAALEIPFVWLGNKDIYCVKNTLHSLPPESAVYFIIYIFQFT